MEKIQKERKREKTMEKEEIDQQLIDLFTRVKHMIQEHPENFEMYAYDAQCGTIHCIGGWANAILRNRGFYGDWEYFVYIKEYWRVARNLENIDRWPLSFHQSLLPKYNLQEMGIYSNEDFDRLLTPEERQEIACARIDWFLDNKEWETETAV